MEAITNGTPGIEAPQTVSKREREEIHPFLRTLINPELLQPSIIAISITYIVYAIGALYNLTPTMPAETQFAYYVASLGLISAILFYAKFATSSEAYTSFMELVHLTFLSIVIGIYILYWFIDPNFSQVTTRNDLLSNPSTAGIINSREGDSYQDAKLNFTCCIDKRKCSHPVHLVLQSVYMLCVVLSFVFGTIRRG